MFMLHECRKAADTPLKLSQLEDSHAGFKEKSPKMGGTVVALLEKDISLSNRLGFCLSFEFICEMNEE